MHKAIMTSPCSNPKIISVGSTRSSGAILVEGKLVPSPSHKYVMDRGITPNQVENNIVGTSSTKIVARRRYKSKDYIFHRDHAMTS